ncbi:ABC transporter permease [Nonomuraea sp. SYSU D8015]|uniref:ABC transporter permease n=1 Tax=Nonomuraea sp. SYSU D8015 TaxID=2593644 RepID=UPI0016618784|nr:ABC transporter permease [Nonomuraea sp. SYSU D8015]
MSTTTESGTTYAPAADVLGTVLTPGAKPARPSAWSASVTFGWRAMLKIKHVPEQLFDVTAFPLMMTLMFTYLFGGALGGSPTKYLQFLLPGIMVTSVVMITMYTGIEVNKDIEKGVFDRFRTLSIWRPSTLVGYLLGDLLRYTIASIVILVIGLVLGFRPQGGITGVAGGTLLLLGFSFAFSWLWTMLGLLMRSEKALMGVSMLVMMPLTFLSNVYVDPSTMPGWLQPFVNASPITHLVSAVRSLMRGTPDVGEITWVLVSAGVLIAVFGTLTMRLYNRK